MKVLKHLPVLSIGMLEPSIKILVPKPHSGLLLTVMTCTNTLQ